MNLTVSTQSVSVYKRWEIFSSRENEDSTIYLSDDGMITMSMSDYNKLSSVAKDPKIFTLAPAFSLISAVIFSISQFRKDFWYSFSRSINYMNSLISSFKKYFSSSELNTLLFIFYFFSFSFSFDFYASRYFSFSFNYFCFYFILFSMQLSSNLYTSS